MLGATVAAVLGADPALRVVRAARDPAGSDVLRFDAESDDPERFLASAGVAWVVNAIGIVKPLIDERDPGSVSRAVAVNAGFPQRLARAASATGARVIQIATDGVFSGREGGYDELAPHDADGVYERTKSGGEVDTPGVVHLRCSIVGPERPPPRSLLGRALAEPPGSRMPGYMNHRWNGVTTLHFARLCGAIVHGGGLELPALLHVVPADAVSKAELLELILAAFGRDDVAVTRTQAPASVDHTLRTLYPETNSRLWGEAGYAQPPSIATMVAELAAGQPRPG